MPSHAAHPTSAGDVIIAGPGYAVLPSMRWVTPSCAVQSLADYLGIHEFDIDVCAEDGNSHAARYLDAADDCITADWGDVRSAFMNPPYGKLGVPRKLLRERGWPEEDIKQLAPFPGTVPFVERARLQARAHDILVAVLLGVSMDDWQRQAMALADDVLFGPRIPFIDAVTGEVQVNPTTAHCALIYRGSAVATRQTIVWDWTAGY